MTCKISEESLEILGQNVAQHRGIVFRRLGGSMKKAGEKMLEGLNGQQGIFNLQYIYFAAESLLNNGRAKEEAEEIFGEMTGIPKEKRKPFHLRLGKLLMEEYGQIENEFRGISLSR